MTAERDGRGWQVRIEGMSPAGLVARDLADVEPRCRKLITERSGVAPADIEVGVEVRLPPVIQDRLEVIRQYCADIEAEYDAATRELIEAGLSLSDVSRVLSLHHWSPRPLTITNAEVAKHGMDRHPDAVGLEWDDHAFALTRKCRAHVEATRGEYRDLAPDGEAALVYDHGGFVCDFCEEAGE